MGETAERTEVFRGHLEECIKHLASSIYAQAPKGTRDAPRLRQPIADFCGVQVASVVRWFTGKHTQPQGEVRFKVSCCLETMGYKVIEMERMPKDRRNFAELIGYGLLTGQQASELLGFTTPATLYQVLMGRVGTREDKEQKMWDAWKERREAIEAKKLEARMTLPDLTPDAGPATKGSRPSAKIVSAKILPRDTRVIVKTMETLDLLLEQTGPEDLRPHADMVLRLSGRLSGLISSFVLKDDRKGVT